MTQAYFNAEGCRAVDTHIDELLDGHKQEVSPEARYHIDQCERCSALYGWVTDQGGAIDHPARVSAELQRKIQTELSADLKPVTPQVSTPRIAWRFVLAFAVVVAVMTLLLSPDGARAMTARQSMGAGVLLLSGIALLSVSLAWQLIPGSLHAFPTSLPIGFVAAVFGLGSLILFPWNPGAASASQGGACLAQGLLLAALSALVFLLLSHRGAGLNPTQLGATVGAIAGLTGVGALHFHCPILEASHIALWHGSVLLVSLAAGAAFGYAAVNVPRRRTH
jgi:hypothetical protein